MHGNLINKLHGMISKKFVMNHNGTFSVPRLMLLNLKKMMIMKMKIDLSWFLPKINLSCIKMYVSCVEL